MKNKNYPIPADIPANAHATYTKNLAAITKNTNRLMLFAADQKMEHLNKDFCGKNIDPDAADPEHLFKIAAEGGCGAFATHAGLIARYGLKYPDIHYIVKLNGKTDIIKPGRWTKYFTPHYNQNLERFATDPKSLALFTIDDALNLKNNGLSIAGVGYTIYLGSFYEQEMLREAAQMVQQAHRHGLIAIVWIYARGLAIKDESSLDLLTGAAGIALSLGADFVKIKAPHHAQDLHSITKAAGNTRVICSGGPAIEPEKFLQLLTEQLEAGAAGCATGRNIFQKSSADALAFSKKISSIVYHKN